MKSNKFQEKLQELIKEGLAHLEKEGPTWKFVIPPYITFTELDQNGYTDTHIEIVTPKEVEKVFDNLGWKCNLEETESDGWDEVWAEFYNDNKKFIFHYKGYLFKMEIYSMHDKHEGKV